MARRDYKRAPALVPCETCYVGRPTVPYEVESLKTREHATIHLCRECRVGKFRTWRFRWRTRDGSD